MVENTAINILNLNNCELGSQGLECIAEAMGRNSGIRELYIASNSCES